MALYEWLTDKEQKDLAKKKKEEKERIAQSIIDLGKERVSPPKPTPKPKPAPKPKKKSKSKK